MRRAFSRRAALMPPLSGGNKRPSPPRSLATLAATAPLSPHTPHSPPPQTLEMAGSNWRRTGGAAANGFAPRTLLKEQTEALRDNGYPVPPDMRVGHGYAISVRGIPVPRPLTRSNRDFHAAQIAHYWRELTPEMRDDPRWNPEDPGNAARYEEAFQRLFEEEMNRWEGPGLAPRDKNVAGREAFWSVHGRTLQAVMDHIANGGSLLEWPHAPPPAPPANVWAPRTSSSRSTGSSSRASSSRASSSRASSSRSSSSLSRVLLSPKPEPMKVKAEPTTLYAELLAAQAAKDEDELLRAAEAASMEDVPPMDGPSACAWSAYMHAIETGVPFVDLTGDGDAGPSRVKKEDDGAGASGVKKEEEDDDPYYAFSRRYRGRQ